MLDKNTCLRRASENQILLSINGWINCLFIHLDILRDTNMGVFEGTSKSLEHELGECVSREDEFFHECTPFCSVPFERPIWVWVGIRRKEDHVLQRNHL